MSVSFLACSECQIPIFAAFVMSFIFLWWTYNPLSCCGLERPVFSAQSTCSGLGCVCMLLVWASWQVGCRTRYCVPASSFSIVKDGTSRISFLELISKVCYFFPKDGVHQRKDRVFYITGLHYTSTGPLSWVQRQGFVPTHPGSVLNVVPSVDIKGKWWQLCLTKAGLVTFIRLNFVYEILNVCSFYALRIFSSV